MDGRRRRLRGWRGRRRGGRRIVDSLARRMAKVRKARRGLGELGRWRRLVRRKRRRFETIRIAISLVIGDNQFMGVYQVLGLAPRGVALWPIEPPDAVLESRRSFRVIEVVIFRSRHATIKNAANRPLASIGVMWERIDNAEVSRVGRKKATHVNLVMETE